MELLAKLVSFGVFTKNFYLNFAFRSYSQPWYERLNLLQGQRSCPLLCRDFAEFPLALSDLLTEFLLSRGLFCLLCRVPLAFQPVQLSSSQHVASRAHSS